MTFDEIKNKLSKRTPAIMGSDSFSKFAVLLPLIKKDGEIHVLFEVRSMNLRRQPGEICFPGGRIDPEDKDERETAIRETCEELRIDQKAIKDIMQLDYLVSPFGTIIYPFVGTIMADMEISPNPMEVKDIFTVPISLLQKMKPDSYEMNFKITPEKNFPLHHIPGGKNYNWQVRTMDEYFYYYEDKIIWGLTARILNHFLSCIG